MKNDAKNKIEVWVVRKEAGSPLRVLLLQTLPKRGDFWQPITGAVEPGEALAEAAARETREETGFDLPAGLFKKLGYDFEYSSDRGHFNEHCYWVAVEKEDPIHLDEHEHCAYEWLDGHMALGRLRFAENKKALQILLAGACQD